MILHIYLNNEALDRLKQELAPVHAARFDGEGAGNICLGELLVL
jgi:hypothetical protein